MRFLFSIVPWFMELFNAPPRKSLSLVQKIGRVLLVTVTLITLSIICSLLVALGFFVLQRSHEVLVGIPQLINALTILIVSVGVNILCVMILFQIRRIDRRLIPERDHFLEIPLPLHPHAARKSKV